MQEEKPTSLNQVKRHSERGNYDRTLAYEITDSHFLCHFSYVFDDVCISLPTLYCRISDTFYLHGAVSNRSLNSLKNVKKVSFTVTHVDGIVLARSAFSSSMNYRSAVIFGTPRVVENIDEKMKAFMKLVESVTPNRSKEIRPINDIELKTTLVLAIDVTEVSTKIRTGDPMDSEEDYLSDSWAGVIPLKLQSLPYIKDSKLKEHIETPPSVLNFDKF